MMEHVTISVYHAQEDETWAVIIGADTIVVKDGEIFEKPGSQSRAREMLEK